MRTRFFVVAIALLLLGPAIHGQIYRFYNLGTIWTVTAIRISSGMDPAYLQYLDGQFKKQTDAQVQAGFMKSYKLLRTLDDEATGWNMLILREYPSLAAMEANAEKADAVTRQLAGDEQAQMKGYEDRSKYREVVWGKTTRELKLK